MKEFFISERYKLEVHWEKVIYEQDGLAKLEGCYLSGPVISNVDKLNEIDYINLDFSSQYIVFVSSYYIAKLSWVGVRYNDGKIYLDNVVLKNKNINSVPKLNGNDYIVIDTKNHEDEKHQFNFNYVAYLIKDDGVLYNFRGK